MVVAISFLQEYAVVCHFSLRHTSREGFLKRDEKCFFLPVPLEAYGANTKYTGR